MNGALVYCEQGLIRLNLQHNNKHIGKYQIRERNEERILC